MDSQAPVRTLVETVLGTKHPETVAQLAHHILSEQSVSEAELVEAVKDMARNKIIVLEKPSYEVQTLLDYLFSITLSGWFWATLAITGISVIAVALSPGSLLLEVPRWVLGSLLVLFLPGYSLLQLLFKESELDTLEQFGFAIITSLALIALMGFILNLTTWGIRFIPMITVLVVFIVAVSTGAALRKYWAVRTGAD